MATILAHSHQTPDGETSHNAADHRPEIVGPDVLVVCVCVCDKTKSAQLAANSGSLPRSWG
jgi:hypothetical protein